MKDECEPKPTIEDVLGALQDAIEAKVEHDKTRDSYDGHSWDYFGHYEIKRMEDAAKRFAEKLEGYIRACIDEKLTERFQS